MLELLKKWLEPVDVRNGSCACCWIIQRWLMAIIA